MPIINVGITFDAAEKIAEKETVLNELYKFHTHILNPKDVPMSLKQLTHGARLSEKKIKDVCEALADEGLIKPVSLLNSVFYRITRRGIKYIESIPDPSTGHINARHG